jgi:hypothetical protein
MKTIKELASLSTTRLKALYKAELKRLHATTSKSYDKRSFEDPKFKELFYYTKFIKAELNKREMLEKLNREEP